MRRARWVLVGLVVAAAAAAAGVWLLAGADARTPDLPALPDAWPWVAGGVVALAVFTWAGRRWGSDVVWWLRYSLPSKVRGY